MKLYYSPAVSALTARILVGESKLPVELVRVRLVTGMADDGEDFRRLHPPGTVPVLQLDDGTLLRSDIEITLALAARMPDHPDLAPLAGTPAHQQMQACLGYLCNAIHPHYLPLFRPHEPVHAKCHAREQLQQGYAHLEATLECQDFLLGNTVTLADAYAFTLLMWSQLVELDLAAWPALEAYVTRMRQRPAVQAALRAEGLLQGCHEDVTQTCDPARRA